MGLTQLAAVLAGAAALALVVMVHMDRSPPTYPARPPSGPTSAAEAGGRARGLLIAVVVVQGRGGTAVDA